MMPTNASLTGVVTPSGLPKRGHDEIIAIKPFFRHVLDCKAGAQFLSYRPSDCGPSKSAKPHRRAAINFMGQPARRRNLPSAWGERR